MKKKMCLIIIFIIFMLLISLIILFKPKKNLFLGTWVSEGGTIYEFEKKNEGVMKTSLSEYKFIYKIKDNVLSLDFQDKNVINANYKFSCKKDKCKMKSDRGTFVFTKKKDLNEK